MKNIRLHKVRAVIGSSAGILLLVLAVYTFISEVPNNAKYSIVIGNLIATCVVCYIWIQFRIKFNAKTTLLAFGVIVVSIVFIDFLLQKYLLNDKGVLQLLAFSFSSVIGFSEGILLYWKKD